MSIEEYVFDKRMINNKKAILSIFSSPIAIRTNWNVNCGVIKNALIFLHSLKFGETEIEFTMA